MMKNSNNSIPRDVYKFFRAYHRCIGCGECCYCTPMQITGKDIRVMSCKLGMTVKEFKKQHTEQYPGVIGLSRFRQENPCIFLDENTRCKIYDARPDTCRKFPFNSKLKLPDNCDQIRILIREITAADGTISNESLNRAQERRRSLLPEQ